MMTIHEFKIWLVTNGYTQKSLAERLNISDRTISNYVSSGTFPTVFIMALKGIEL